MTAHLIRTRFAGVCQSCRGNICASAHAWWNPETKALECIACRPRTPTTADLAHLPPPDIATRIYDRGVAGGSAQRQFERLHDRTAGTVRAQRRRLPAFMNPSTSEPRFMVAWAKGAVGERQLGVALESLAPLGVIVLHDRRIPASRANIDHLAIAPSGVFVVDAKNYKGEIRKTASGWRRADPRLLVDGRDQTHLLRSARHQAAAVRAALGIEWQHIRVVPLMCFLAARPDRRPTLFEFEGVYVGRTDAVCTAVASSGQLDDRAVRMLAELLDRKLRMA